MGREIRRLREAVLSREIGAVRKEWGGRTSVALVYPNRYEAGMSNLGFLTIHGRINARPDALCERAFLPGPGEARILSRRATPLATLESGRPLDAFDIVAISLSYENDLQNVPGILAGGRIPPFRSDRAAAAGRSPLVLAGGFAASLSPEPSGIVADAVVVGDGERAIEAIIDLGTPRAGDAGYLRELASIPGVYVPSGYDPEYGPPGGDAGPGAGRRLLGLRARAGFPDRVAREVIPIETLSPVPVVVAEKTELGRMALVETSRGCPKLCGFCAAAHACPKFREFPLGHVRVAAEAAWPHRKTFGLVGAAVLDWRPFREFAREILARGGAVSPASVRADLVDGEIADILKRSGHRTVTLAPECGSGALRARIGKDLPDEAFFGAARTLARAGIVSFKLYFLVGLPCADGEEEVEGTVAFLAAFRETLLSECRRLGRMGTITAVLSPFVPKPFTPLQWAPMAPLAELSARQAGIARRTRGTPNLRVTPEAPRTAAVEAYLGLSDRRAEDALRRARNGRIAVDREACEPAMEEVVFREKPADAFFPWDVVAGGLPKRTLRARYERIMRR